MSIFKKSRILLLISVLALLVVAFLLLADPLFHLDFGILTDRTTATSTIVALAGRDLMRLNTLEAVYKVVFPYDFIPQDHDWKAFNDSIAEGYRPRGEEAGWLEVLYLSDSAGLDITQRANDFIVVTVVAKLGFDLEAFATESRSVANGSVGPISVRTDGTVVVNVPRVVVNEIIIEDSSSADYHYPDVGVSPEGWKLISEYVAASIPRRLEADGLFGEAEAAGRGFLSGFFREAGYESVKFFE